MKRTEIIILLLLIAAFVYADKRVACIGNSVTYGSGHRQPEQTSYPVQLSRMLGEGYEVKNADFFKIGIPFTLSAIVPAYILIWILFG